jgi:mycothiol-dependent nitroreductase-like protein
MEGIAKSATTIYVDPSCPFAWITYRWLAAVERHGAIELSVRLLSLSVVNEHRELDAWYRGFNDKAWGPARVMLAVTEQHGEDAARRFYDAFGSRFHVELDTGDDVDRNAIAADALADASLSPSLIDAATDSGHDEALRDATHRALEPVGLDVGVPVVVMNEISCAGPVFSKIPTDAEAVVIYQAFRTLASQPGFMRIERQRVGDLVTA